MAPYGQAATGAFGEKIISPSAVIFFVDSAKHFRFETQQQIRIDAVLSNLLPDLSHRRVRFGLPFDRQDFIWSDFVIREHAPLGDVVAALNAGFELEPRIPIRLEVSEEKFRTFIVKGSPDVKNLPLRPSLNMIPQGYQSTDPRPRQQFKWSTLCEIIGQESLGLEIQFESKDDPVVPFLQIDVPNNELRLNPTQTREAFEEMQAARKKLQNELQKIAPAAIKEQLGVDIEIREILLPVLSVLPAK